VPDNAKRAAKDDDADETDLAAETEDSERAGHAKSAA
jgi:hypothetical protein